MESRAAGAPPHNLPFLLSDAILRDRGEVLAFRLDKEAGTHSGIRVKHKPIATRRLKQWSTSRGNSLLAYSTTKANREQAFDAGVPSDILLVSAIGDIRADREQAFDAGKPSVSEGLPQGDTWADREQAFDAGRMWSHLSFPL
jgi:hypothetical protein